MHLTAPLRWPRPSRGLGDEEDGDENMTSLWTNDSISIPSTTNERTHAKVRQQISSGRAPLTTDEDSEPDLLQLDMEEDLVPQDSLQESGFGDAHDGR